ncbi:MAG TPA: hypothetical protein VH109_10440 [Steroidobacteraceae bacterium]|jgi:hypothetical protein|nr:hypothetical protein [Steroidobacteraceae bacterium]
MRIATVVKSLLAVTAVGMPLLVNAESNFQTGAAALTATAHVDFQITIPKFLFLRVGTGTGTAAGGFANNATIDEITWAPTAAQVGTGALTGTGGDLTGGVETAAVVANNGNVVLSSTTTSALSDGGGDTISYAQITTTAAHNTTGTTLAAPALADGATTNVTLTAVGKIVQQDAQWTYKYANTLVPPAGTYGGVNVNGGRVTYTAALP